MIPGKWAIGRAAAVALLFSGTCGAQPEATVARPEVKVGDRWTYQRVDYDANQARGRYEMQVVFADRGVIQVVSTQKFKEEEVDTTYTQEWNAVSTASRVFYPHTDWLRFPLRVGATYKTGYDTVVAKKGWKSRNEREVTVVGWEDVVVPAGKFRALKVVSNGRFERLDKGSVSGTSRNVIWYVPGIKRWAKITLENRPAGGKGKGKGEYSGEELVEYKVQ